MKRFLMITLMAITAVAVVAAPGWAAGGRKLSDRQLDNVHAGWSDPVSDAHSADADANADSAGSIFIAGAASSAAAATASDVASALAVKINNKCAAGFCKLKVETEAEDSGSSVTTNAQSILNTLASVNAVQVNVVGGTGGTQTNTAYSAEGAIGEIDSAENGAAAASADTLVDTTSTPPWASADSSASAATSASSTLAFATPRVEIKNRCAAGFCKLQVETEAENGGTVTTNAQSILNTVASVNAVQINVAASGSTLQSNTAYSTK